MQPDTSPTDAMKEQRVEVLILGLDAAALEAARTLESQGVRFAILTGTPAGAGLARDPSFPLTTLLHAAHLGFEMRHSHPFGFLHAEEVTVDPIRVMQRVREVREKAVAARLRAYESLLPALRDGAVVFESPDRVKAGTTTFVFERLIVTDAPPHRLPVELGPLAASVRTLHDVFDLAALPKQVVVMGAGSRALGLAQGLARLGSAVTCLAPRAEPFGGLEDPEVVSHARKWLAKEFAIVDCDPSAVEARPGEGAKVRIVCEGFDTTAGCVVVATDAKDYASCAWLGAYEREAGGAPVFDPVTLALKERGGGTMGGKAGSARVPPAWIAGAAHPLTPGSHTAALQGRRAALGAIASLRGQGNPPPETRQWRVTLETSFTSPGVARVGQAYGECMREGARVLSHALGDGGISLVCGKEGGLVRLYVDANDGRLLGAEMAMEKAEHLAQTLALAMHADLRANDLASLAVEEPVWEQALVAVSAEFHRPRTT